MLTVVMMAGLPCAGKSTLATSLAKELGWQLIDKDKYRGELIEDGMSVNAASWAAYKRSFRELRQALANQHSVIFDTAARDEFILDGVKEIVHETGDVRLKVILCLIERHHRLRRLEERKQLEEREHEPPFKHHTLNRVDPPSLVDYRALFSHLPSDTLQILTHISSPQECVELAKAYIFS